MSQRNTSRRARTGYLSAIVITVVAVGLLVDTVRSGSNSIFVALIDPRKWEHVSLSLPSWTDMLAHKIESLNGSNTKNGVVPPPQSDTPSQVVSILYQPYLDDLDAHGLPKISDEDSIRRYASKSLASIIDKNIGCEKGLHEECAISSGILIDGQDWKLANFRIGNPTIRQNRQTIRAHFTNFGGRQTVAYIFIEEDGEWKIDDVVMGSTTLKQMLSEYFKQECRKDSRLIALHLCEGMH